MTSTRVFHLSNLAAGQEFDLTVAEGSDVLAAAQSHLEESGLYGDMQHGFYISVYPRAPEGDAPTAVTHIGSGEADGGEADGGEADGGDPAILA